MREVAAEEGGVQVVVCQRAARSLIGSGDGGARAPERGELGERVARPVAFGEPEERVAVLVDLLDEDDRLPQRERVVDRAGVVADDAVVPGDELRGVSVREEDGKPAFCGQLAHLEVGVVHLDGHLRLQSREGVEHGDAVGEVAVRRHVQQLQLPRLRPRGGSMPSAGR